MAEQKTKPTEQSVDAFLDKVPAEQTRDDCRMIIQIMTKVTGAPPAMWGPNIIGFGKYHYKYASGHEGDSCLTGFSPRKAAITLYIMPTDPGQEALMQRLGKHKAGKGCIYVKRLDDIDMKVLEELMTKSVSELRNRYAKL
ncbi:MAG TPA: DUF1801 domain-containing protein [Chryseolinea sp.]|nr:DUF1801 domain-containing protein [Chryseolinea sp.]